MVLFYILTAVAVVSLVSLIGAITLVLRKRFLDKLKLILISLAAGVFIGNSFFHLLPEALKSGAVILQYTTFGIIAFFLLERFFYWRHCHNGKCDIHTFTYMSLFGDGLHNFIDGLIISTSFIASIPLGVITTIAVIFHEIPQEISDFSVLISGGFTRGKALFYNFLSSLTSIAGALFGYFFVPGGFVNLLIAFTAGGFIYIATSDLIPELHKETDIKKSILQLVIFIIGILLMLAL